MDTETTYEFHFENDIDAWTCANALDAAGAAARVRTEETQHYTAVFLYPDEHCKQLADEAYERRMEAERLAAAAMMEKLQQFADEETDINWEVDDVEKM
jgi:hypothetical protein